MISVIAPFQIMQAKVWLENLIMMKMVVKYIMQRKLTDPGLEIELVQRTRGLSILHLMDKHFVKLVMILVSSLLMLV